MTDRRILLVTAFLRAAATAMVAVLLGTYLAHLRLGPAAVGGAITSGLVGGTLATALVTWAGDRLGRRRVLVALALLGAAGGALLAAAGSESVVLLAAFVGMVNGLGRDRGAALVLEQAMLPATAAASERTAAFAWYSVAQDAGHALGSLCAALPVALRRGAGLPVGASFRAALVAYALALLAIALASARLSPAVDAPPSVSRGAPRLAPDSRRVLARICALFALDSLGGGFLATTLVSAFFVLRFGASEVAIAVLFFGARVANAGSHLGAAWLARRIGLVNTMVFTHLPSSVLLLTVPWAPSFGVAAALFLVREGLVEMDVPTRQSYVMAVVRPEERTVAAGATYLVRTGAAAVAPWVAGGAMQAVALATPLFVGAGLKIVYDVLLYAAFRGVRPPEEHGAAIAPAPRAQPATPPGPAP